MTNISPSPTRSRPRLLAGTTQSSYPAFSTLLPEGQVDDETAELLHEFVHPHPHTPVEELPDPIAYDIGGAEIDKVALEAQRRELSARPWWRRPSATWYIVLSPLSAVAVAALIAPRLQLYTNLVCEDLDGRRWDPAGGGVGSDTWHVGQTRPVPCIADPVVQANVAKLLTITATLQGILSCLTAAFWGSFSDRYGRVRFLGLNITALLLSDSALVALAVAPKHVPGGYWFPVYVSALEGLIGGRSAGIAAVHAYLADCSDSATRSRIFSQFLGLVFTGMALGPSLGGVTERLAGSSYTIFYVALGLHVINAIFSWFVVPESLLPAQMDAARRAKRAESKGRWSSRILSFIAPLAVLVPAAQKKGVTPQKVLKKDWSLTWLAFSYALDSCVIGGLQYVIQYAAGAFNWTGEIVGYYLSIVGITRALFLAFGLPVILHLFAPKPPPVQLPISPEEPLDARSSPQRSRSESAPKHGPVHSHTPVVDLGLAKVSLSLHVVCFVLMAVSKEASVFVGASALGALAAGYSPAMYSLSLELYARRGGSPSEAGRLFGAMSVIQALGNQIVGPSLFGLLYIKTVATFPEAMFYAFAAAVMFALFFLFLVRIPSDPEATVVIDAVDVEVEVEAPPPEEEVVVPTIVVEDELEEEPARGRRQNRAALSDRYIGGEATRI